MALVTELELPTFDYTDPSLRGPRFHEVMAELRTEGWLAAGPFGYFVLDHEAGELFLRTRSAIFPGRRMAELFNVAPGPLLDQIERNILNVNGDDHRRLRNLVNPALSARAIERYRPAMRDYLQRLFEPLSQAGRCEFVEAVAKPYPSLVIATVMGAPLEDSERLHHWSNWIQRQFDAPSMVSERDGIEQAVAEFYEYAGELLRARRADPGDDLISSLIAAEEAGERLSDVECVNLVLNVLVGGVDTTQSQLAQAIALFAMHPDQWELLRDDVSLAPRAVEEVLRFEPITPFTARILEEEVEFRGVTFPKDTIVMVSAFTGNRDGAVEQSFDITAEQGAGRLLTFGAGIHFCVGANLARAEMQEALAFLAPRMPDLRLEGDPGYESITGIYGLSELPVRWG